MRTCEVDIFLEIREGAGEWTAVPLTPEELFWADPDEPDEVWGIRSPWNFSAPLAHIPNANRALRVRLRLVNRSTQAFQIADYQHWNGLDGFVCLSSFGAPGQATEQELILVSPIPMLDNGSQVVRIDLGSDSATVIMNQIMHGRGGDEHTINLLE